MSTEYFVQTALEYGKIEGAAPMNRDSLVIKASLRRHRRMEPDMALFSRQRDRLTGPPWQNGRRRTTADRQT
jgi:hypothetical protein